jgi:hypothetical protein
VWYCGRQLEAKNAWGGRCTLLSGGVLSVRSNKRTATAKGAQRKAIDELMKTLHKAARQAGLYAEGEATGGGEGR